MTVVARPSVLFVCVYNAGRSRVETLVAELRRPAAS
jgi:protein-tyrosine-phosphatase